MIMTLAGRKRRQKNASVKTGRRIQPDPAILLAWYDRHQRRLPWRALPGQKSDPYRVWLSEIMLQQTTVKAVAPYYERFLTRWPSAKDLGSAKLGDVLKLWAGLGYYARARNLHACARAVAEQYGGHFPSDEKTLLTLPGIGTYTAAAVASIAFGKKATPIDGNIERVIARLFAVEDALPGGKPQIRAHAEKLTPDKRAGDFAQAMMDLGATLCTPKRPACSLCPWNEPCAARKRGDQETFPRKVPKVEGKLRRGAAYVALRADGAILVRTRPEKGLLGGMTEVPTTEWRNDFQPREAAATAPLAAQWKKLPGVVTHVFTHFPLELAIYRATLPKRTRAPKGARWTPVRDIHGEALPNVMRKVIAHALNS
jgi:A/G-specific adenine glycosylase